MKSEFSVGLTDKVCEAWDGEGGTPAELNSFVERTALIRGVLAVVRAEAVVKPVQSSTAAKSGFQFKVGRSIKLGLFKTPEQYRKVLQAVGANIGTYAGQILEKITFAKTVTEVDLSEPFNVADLGFTIGLTRYDAIKKRIVELGGEICPNEVGPAMRVQYLDQPKGEWFRTVMEPLAGAFGDLDVFYIEHGGRGLWLLSFNGDPSTLYDPDDWFVCVVPRKK